jgi:hypothetical protein
MKAINILELHRTINSKKSLQREIYDIVLGKCHKRIELMTENLNLKCFFKIPSFVVGYPLYDLNKCIEHILESLKKNGFIVKYFFPNYLYISWDFNEIEKTPPVTNNNISLTKSTYLSASPIQKITNNAYKPILSSTIQKNNNGKLTINL